MYIYIYSIHMSLFMSLTYLDRHESYVQEASVTAHFRDPRLPGGRRAVLDAVGQHGLEQRVLLGWARSWLQFIGSPKLGDPRIYFIVLWGPQNLVTFPLSISNHHILYILYTRLCINTCIQYSGYILIFWGSPIRCLCTFLRNLISTPVVLHVGLFSEILLHCGFGTRGFWIRLIYYCCQNGEIYKGAPIIAT